MLKNKNNSLLYKKFHVPITNGKQGETSLNPVPGPLENTEILWLKTQKGWSNGGDPPPSQGPLSS